MAGETQAWSRMHTIIHCNPTRSDCYYRLSILQRAVAVYVIAKMNVEMIVRMLNGTFMARRRENER